MKPILPYTPGRPLRADDLNAQLAQLVHQGGIQLTGGDGDLLQSQMGGVQLSVQRPERFIWAEITGGNNPYSWRELRPATGGTWTTKTLGRTGTTTRHPAYEIGGNPLVPQNQPVKLRRGFAGIVSNDLSQEWLFRYCCVPGLTPPFMPPGPSGTASGSGVDGATYVFGICGCEQVKTHLLLTITPASMPPGLYGYACSCWDTLVIPMRYWDPLSGPHPDTVGFPSIQSWYSITNVPNNLTATGCVDDVTGLPIYVGAVLRCGTGLLGDTVWRITIYVGAGTDFSSLSAYDPYYITSGYYEELVATVPCDPYELSGISTALNARACNLNTYDVPPNYGYVDLAVTG